MSTTRSRGTSTRRSARDRVCYVALLRGVNVGKRQVLKDTLRDAFAHAGGRNVRTVIASGNVLFEASPGRAPAIVAAACTSLASILGAEPLVMLRTAREIAALAGRGPFAEIDAPPIVKRYIVFLAVPPRRRPRLPVSDVDEALELVSISKRECWVVSGRKPNGWYGFPVAFVERVVGVEASARSWSTVLKLAALMRQT